MTARDLKRIRDLILGEVELFSELFAGRLTLILLLKLRERLGDLIQRPYLIER